jgi:hypothetical protein
MLSDPNKPLVLTVVDLNVVMLNVAAPNRRRFMGFQNEVRLAFDQF